MTQDSEPLQHTPGPWYAELITTDKECWFKVMDSQDVTVADLPIQPLDPEGWPRGNAELIATSPDLLRAGEAVVAAWESGDLAAAVRELGAACAEARGQA